MIRVEIDIEGLKPLKDAVSNLRKELPNLLRDVLEEEPSFVFDKVTDSNVNMWKLEGGNIGTNWGTTLVDTGNLRESMTTDRLELEWDAINGVIRWKSEVDYGVYVAERYLIYGIAEGHLDDVAEYIAEQVENKMEEVWNDSFK